MVDEKLVSEITKILARELSGKGLADDPGAGSFSVKVGVSARHVHLSRKDMDLLFGAGSELTFYKELMGGQFAAKEMVTIIGLKLRPIENVRILGPLRSQTQVEVSETDCIRLGVKAPVRLSGDLSGSASITLVGPKGAVTIPEGCIVAQRHIHLNPETAQKWGVKDGQRVRVQCPDLRGGILENVPVRVHPSFDVEMHIDTDEANGLGIHQSDVLPVMID